MSAQRMPPGNGEETPPGGYGGTQYEVEIGRLHVENMSLRKDLTIIQASERACSEHLGRRIDAVSDELARLGRHVAECSASMRELQRDIKLFFDERT